MQDRYNPNDYSNDSFWNKLKHYASSAGREVVEKALMLYFCMTDRDTPPWAKTIIAGALGYFILPIDAIPDIAPIVGYTDDLGALCSACAMVIASVKPEHLEKAKEKLRVWFG